LLILLISWSPEGLLRIPLGNSDILRLTVGGLFWGTRIRNLQQHLPPDRLRPRPAGLDSPSRPCPVRTARAHDPAGQAQVQGSGVGAAGPEHGAGHSFLRQSPAAALGPRSASRPPLPMPPCPTRYAAPPAGATTSSLDLALPAPHAPAHPAAACLPRALLPLLPCSPCPGCLACLVR